MPEIPFIWWCILIKCVVGQTYPIVSKIEYFTKWKYLSVSALATDFYPTPSTYFSGPLIRKKVLLYELGEYTCFLWHKIEIIPTILSNKMEGKDTFKIDTNIYSIFSLLKALQRLKSIQNIVYDNLVPVSDDHTILDIILHKKDYVKEQKYI